MASLNQVQLIGNLGADPEIRSTQDGSKVANFTLATSEAWKDKTTGEKKEKTEWHRVTVWGDGLVGVIEQYVSKGSKVYISGKLQTRKWTDQDGEDRYTTEVVLSGIGSQLILLGASGSNNEKPAPSSAEPADIDDEIPF